MSATAAEMVAPSAVSAPIKPYRGLAPYSEADERFFFGREEERRVIVANLLASRITVLYGASGVGKSSVLGAGVVPHLRRLGEQNRRQMGILRLAVVSFPRRGRPEEPNPAASSSWAGDPALDLSGEIRQSCAEALGAGDFRGKDPDESLAAYARWCVSHVGELFVVLDQFEEFFVYHGAGAAGNAFLAELAEAVNRPGLRANFLLGIREDALSRLDRLKPLIPGVFDRNLRMDLLTRESARDAITKPVEMYNELVGEMERVQPPDRELVEDVLAGVRSGRVGFGLEGRAPDQPQDGGDEARAGIEASYLQLVMTRLWDEAQRKGTRDGRRALRVETFRRLGGAQKIVEAHLESAMQELKRRERDAAAIAFQYLVTPSGAKVAYPLLDLAEQELSGDGPDEGASRDGTRPQAWGLAVEVAGQMGRWLTSRRPVDKARRWLSARSGVKRSPLESALRKLSGEARILREVPGPLGNASERRYEIFHDVLSPAILRWRLRYQADRRRRKLLRVALAVGAVLLTVALYTFNLYVDAARERDRADTASAQFEQLLAQTKSALARQILSADSGAVTDARFSPGGTRILTANEDGTAWIWDTDGNPLVQITGHTGGLTSAAFSPDGKLVVTSSEDRTAKVWDSTSGRQLFDLVGHRMAVSGALFSGNGNLILTWSEDGSARVWSATTGVQIANLVQQDPVQDAEFNPQGTLVLTAGAGGAKVWSLRTRVVLALLGQPGDAVSAEFSPDGRLVLTAGTDGVGRLWDWMAAREVHAFRPFAGPLRGAHFSPNGRLIVAFAGDTAQIWSVRSGKLVHTFRGHDGEINSADFSPDGHDVVTASDDDTAILWSVANGRALAVLRGHTARVLVARFSPNGEQVVTASADGTARTWG